MKRLKWEYSNPILFILIVIFGSGCGVPQNEDKDKDGVPPRLVSLSVEHDQDPEEQNYNLVVEGRTSSETVEQQIQWEISASLRKDEAPESCTIGDTVKVFYQQHTFEVEPESKYYILACGINKANGQISEEILEIVNTKAFDEVDETVLSEEPVYYDPNAPLCVNEPEHCLCTGACL